MPAGSKELHRFMAAVELAAHEETLTRTRPCALVAEKTAQATTDDGQANSRPQSMAQAFQLACDALANPPPLRQKKVDALRAAMQKGVYEVRAERLAQDMLNGHGSSG